MMDRIDSVDEILEFAIAREVEANQFYMYMAKRMENPELSKVCEEFAKEELEHKAKLELEVMKRGEMVSDFDISDYMMELGNEIDMDYKELLVFAITKEEISISLYSDLAAAIKDKESRDMLLSLAQEETKHKERFKTEYKKYKSLLKPN
jgi:rubrerythrin